MSEIILGLNAYHADSSACIVVGGNLVAAAEEERFRRVKHWAGFPSESIKYCLSQAGAKLVDVSHIAVNSDPQSAVARKIMYALKNRPDFSLIIDRLRNAKRRHSIEGELRKNFPGDEFNGEIRKVEHHLAHLASAYYCAPFDSAAAISIDGFGDFASAAFGSGKNGELSVDERVYFPHSMGIFYQALTQHLGFPNYGDEYKVMGLGPYGKPRFIEEMRDVVITTPEGSFALNLEYFRHHKEKVEYQWSGGTPEIGILYSNKLSELIGPPRKSDAELTTRDYDLAHSIQARYEEVFFHILKTLHAQNNSENIVIAGGCGMNSVANGKIRRRSSFGHVYIQSAAGDAGGAVGAALEVRRQLHGTCGIGQMPHAYWGPEFSNDYVKQVLDDSSAALNSEGCKVTSVENQAELCEKTALAIASGLVIGWFQGRMEWGPRALGNRSIICDPRRADMKDILNLKIKRRESFRPFAPSILREHAEHWFEEEDDVPFMMKVFQVQASKREIIPAVTHVDGSGRLQTVSQKYNERYYDLISSFYGITGVPIVLNTSFNENEPVVCRPQEALNCFLRTKMDVLVIGNYMVERVSE